MLHESGLERCNDELVAGAINGNVFNDFFCDFVWSEDDGDNDVDDDDNDDDDDDHDHHYSGGDGDLQWTQGDCKHENGESRARKTRPDKDIWGIWIITIENKSTVKEVGAYLEIQTFV